MIAKVAPLTAKLRVNFTAEEATRIQVRARDEARSVASVIRLATLAYLNKEGDDDGR